MRVLSSVACADREVEGEGEALPPARPKASILVGDGEPTEGGVGSGLTESEGGGVAERVTVAEGGGGTVGVALPPPAPPPPAFPSSPTGERLGWGVTVRVPVPPCHAPPPEAVTCGEVEGAALSPALRLAAEEGEAAGEGLDEAVGMDVGEVFALPLADTVE